MTIVAAVADDFGGGPGPQPRAGRSPARRGARARRARGGAAGEFRVHGHGRGGQARDRRGRGRRADPGVPRAAGARARSLDRRRDDPAAACPARRALPRPRSSTTPAAGRSRATTRSTCSTSRSRAGTRATGNPPPCGRARLPSASIRRPAGSAWRCATTCGSRSCSGGCWRWAPSGSACRPPSPCRRARAHWETLLRARAIENLCHVVAPAQSGFHENGRETYGDSMIVDCWGRVLARLPRGTGVVTGDIDLVRQREVRQNFPSVEHRRLMP